MQPNKIVTFKKEARAELKKGIDLVANAVKITLGPRGRNVAIQRIGQAPIITNDGVSIANAIKVKDQYQNMGVEMAKEVARRTDRVAGDGTTTTLVLYQALIEEGLKTLEKNTNVMKLKEGMDLAKNYIVEELKKKAQKVEGLDEIQKVAYISVENSKLSSMIAALLNTVGVDGNIIVEETEKPDITVDFRAGYTIDKGFASPYIINNPGKMAGEYASAKVLVTDRRLMSSENLIELIKKMQATGNSNLLLVADDIGGERFISAEMTHDEGLFNIIPVRFACYSQDRKELLEDLAAVCNTKVFGQGRGKDIKDLDIDDLGSVDKIVIKKDTTLLLGARGGTEARVDVIKEQLTGEITDSQKQFLSSRLANMESKTAVVKVGALTEQERKYYKLKIDDAINATRGAIEEGIVEGGGFALASIAMSANLKEENKDVQAGIETVLLACMYPFATLIENSGEDMNGELKRYNASTGKFVDNLIDEGVVDPVKVTTNALINSVSGASLFLTTEVAIAFEGEYKPE